MSPAASVSGVILALARASQPRPFPRFIFNVAASPARDEGTSAPRVVAPLGKQRDGCVASLSTGTPAGTPHVLLGPDACPVPDGARGDCLPTRNDDPRDQSRALVTIASCRWSLRPQGLDNSGWIGRRNSDADPHRNDLAGELPAVVIEALDRHRRQPPQRDRDGRATTADQPAADPGRSRVLPR
jgi:hypothetical protein